MYKAGIALCDTPATLLFETASLHKSDSRPLAARFSVGVSKQFRVDNLWMNTAAARGHLGTTSLVRPCNMAQPASKERGVGDTKLTPKDRTVQLGKDAHLAILNGFVLDTLRMNSCWTLSAGNKALVVQLEPGEFGELGHAILDEVLEGETTRSTDTPMISYKGIYVNYAACLPDNSTDKV